MDWPRFWWGLGGGAVAAAVVSFIPPLAACWWVAWGVVAVLVWTGELIVP